MDENVCADLSICMALLEIAETRLAINNYSLPHIAICAPQSVDKKRPVFCLGGQFLKVEEFVTRILIESGYKVFKGEDASLFFAVLSFNFEHSYFFETCKAWVGAGAEAVLAQLGATVTRCLAQGALSDDLLDQALDLLLRYYASYPPKQAVYSQLEKVIRDLERATLFRVIRLYREMGYTTQGVPDLFVSRNQEFWFAEAKTSHDALSLEQYSFLEHFSKTVGANIAVIRVLPS